MKRFAASSAFALLLLDGPSGFSQQAPSTADNLGTPIMNDAPPNSASDSLRRQIHRLFKTARTLNTIAFVSGSLVTYSAIRYIAKGPSDWQTGVNLAVGAGLVTTSGSSLLTRRFSRRRQKQVLAELERGVPLPADLLVWQQTTKAWPFSRKYRD